MAYGAASAIMSTSKPKAPNDERPKTQNATRHRRHAAHCGQVQAGGAVFARYDKAGPGGKSGGLHSCADSPNHDAQHR